MNVIPLSFFSTLSNKDLFLFTNKSKTFEILPLNEIYVFLNALPVDHTNIYIEQTVNVEMFDFVDGVYLVKNNEEIVGYIMTVTAEGRWGDIKYMIGISAIEDTIIQFEIIESQEQWGAFIETDSFKEQFVGKTSEHYLNSMYDLGVGKRLQIKFTNLFIYAPYISYYNDMVLKSPYVIMPLIGTNIGITKKFKLNLKLLNSFQLRPL